MRQILAVAFLLTSTAAFAGPEDIKFSDVTPTMGGFLLGDTLDEARSKAQAMEGGFETSEETLTLRQRTKGGRSIEFPFVSQLKVKRPKDKVVNEENYYLGFTSPAEGGYLQSITKSYSSIVDEGAVDRVSVEAAVEKVLGKPSQYEKTAGGIDMLYVWVDGEKFTFPERELTFSIDTKPLAVDDSPLNKARLCLKDNVSDEVGTSGAAFDKLMRGKEMYGFCTGYGVVRLLTHYRNDDLITTYRIHVRVPKSYDADALALTKHMNALVAEAEAVSPKLVKPAGLTVNGL